MTSSSSGRVDLDYRFGWRLLLPAGAGSGEPTILGYNPAEKNFLEYSLRHKGRGLLVAKGNLDLVDVDNFCTVAVSGHSRDVSRSKKVLQRAGLSIRSYALLPPDNPRIVVPLYDPNHTQMALALHRPGRWSARMAVALMRLILRTGLQLKLGHAELLIATKQGFGSDGDCALYLGNPTSQRKTILLPLKDKHPKRIQKLAFNPEARIRLKREADALGVMSQTALKENVPHLLQLSEVGEVLILEQTYRPRRYKSSKSLIKEKHKFLAGLAQIERSISTEVPELPLSLPKYFRASGIILQERVRAFLDKNGPYFTCRAHGDFAPWNYSWTEHGFFVFDWEDSRPGVHILSDLIYDSLAPLVHVERSLDGKRALRVARDAAYSFEQESTLRRSEVGLYIALELLRRAGTSDLIDNMMVLMANEHGSFGC